MKLKIVFKGSSNPFGDGLQWVRGQILGKGGFGSVYEGFLKDPITSYDHDDQLWKIAVKSATVSNSDSLKDEHEALKLMVGCPNIIQCFGEEITTGINGNPVYNLLLEYGAGGNLLNRIYKAGKLSEAEVRWYTRSILEGLAYIHEVGYVHCDLKPENILLVPTKRSGSGREEIMAKICDFGLAKRANWDHQKRKYSKSHMTNGFQGTLMYLPPEAVRDGVQEPPGDVWALGCVVLEMLTGKQPWPLEEGMDHKAFLLQKIGKGRKIPQIPKGLSLEAQSFLKCCLNRMVERRLCCKTLLLHPFVDVKDLPHGLSFPDV